MVGQSDGPGSVVDRQADFACRVPEQLVIALEGMSKENATDVLDFDRKQGCLN
jgi:hypothetical protein